MLSPKVIRIEPEAPYVLLVTFETGERRRFDLSPHLDAGVFQELRQRELFEQARAERWGVSWPTGQDLSRDTLYLEGVPVVETDLETSI